MDHINTLNTIKFSLGHTKLILCFHGLFHGLLIPKNRPGWQVIKEYHKTIYIQSHNTPQKVTLAKQYNVLLDHMAILTSVYFFGILQKYDPENSWNIRLIWCGLTTSRPGNGGCSWTLWEVEIIVLRVIDGEIERVKGWRVEHLITQTLLRILQWLFKEGRG